MSEYLITKEWVEKFRTGSGGWTRIQLHAIGVAWPPVKGWKDRVIGKLIPEENRLAFEEKIVLIDAPVRRKKVQPPKPQGTFVDRREQRRLRKAAKRAAKRLKIAQPKPTKKPSKYKVEAAEFYASDRWKELRYLALKNCGSQCLCCGATRADGAVLHVDHIKPRYHYPELQWELSNLQVLCADCNIGKRAWDETDWRSDAMRENMAHMKSIKNEEKS
jgi:5-methylcytosine-specific restriction endonuclease McrA